MRPTRLVDLWRPPESEAAGLFETEVPSVANDDVVEQRDVEDFASRGESTCDGEIIRRWCRIAAWVIMAGDDGGGVGQERSGEHLARLCCGRSYVG